MVRGASSSGRARHSHCRGDRFESGALHQEESLGSAFLAESFVTIQVMNCPVCNQPMQVISVSVTNNGKQGSEYKEYDRTVYQCTSDDVWANVELPKKV